MEQVNVTIYNEFVHEQKNDFVKSIYPKGMHEAIAEYMRKQSGFEVKTATLDMPEHGLTEDVLKSTDVLMWWGHIAHGEVRDEIVDRVQSRVLQGMGLIMMHSGHFSKIFKRLMGTSCGLIYFFFSVPHHGVIGTSATLGIWVLMLGFGTSFGLTVMARLSLFIGRIIFILKNWLELPWLMPG